MSDEFTDIVRLAKKATRGKWIAVGFQVENERDDLPDICNTNLDHIGCSKSQMIADADYIAAAQPKVVIEMIKELRHLRRCCGNAN